MKKFFTYLFSFLIPLIIVAIAWYFVGFYPFGDQTIMAIDFGNQYIDLFAFMRESILTGDWTALFHSFSKSIGGSTVGLWAYYLMSPFNLLYLFFPKENIAIPATLTVFLRYGFMALAMAYYLDKRQIKTDAQRKYIPIFATIYALCGFTVSYQMNPLFMDALIILPLIITALEELLDGQSPHKYVFLLALAIITQFYTAFMIAIFIVLYSIFYIISKYGFHSWKETLKLLIIKLSRMALYSLLAAGIIGIFIMPVFYNLLQSKGELQTGMVFKWELQIQPLEILAKLFIGAFDNNSWSAGPNLPNIYVGSLPLIGLILYYFSKEIPLREKLASFFIFAIFFISVVHKFTNQLWHMGQSPAGFFYRFTFLISFLMVILAFRYFVKDGQVNYIHMFLVSSFMLLTIAIVFPQEHTFLEDEQLQITVMFFALVIIALVLKTQWKWLFIAAFVFTELGVNMQMIQSRLNYTNEPTFRNAIQITDQVIDEIRPDSNNLYRIHNLFYRSKNDPFMQDFPGTTNFSSNLENHTREFFDRIGSNGINAATTYNGSFITDAILGIQYFVDDKDMASDQVESNVDYIFRNDFIRKDIENNYPVYYEDHRFQVYQSDHSLSMAFVVDQAMVDVKLLDKEPVANHEYIGQALVKQDQPYFTKVNPQVTYTGIDVIADNENQKLVKKQDQVDQGSISFQFTPRNNHSYYVQLPETVRYNDNNRNSFNLNGSRLPLITNFNDPQLVNLASNSQGQSQTLTIHTSAETNIDLSNLAIVEFNDTLFKEAIDDLQAQSLKIESWDNHQIKGTVEVLDDNQYLMTSIPYDKGWLVKVDNQPVETMMVLDTFLAIPISKGNHSVQLTFTPPGLWIGLAMSVVFIILYGLVIWYEDKNLKTE